MKAVKSSQRVMVWCLVWLTGLQPLLPAWAAGVTVASGNTSLEAAGNGVPVVNIATPNAAGLSHNRYNDFNVDNRGLILNNGTAQLTQSQLGGLLQNNPNLNGRAASAIINEVVSPNRSHLAGYLEVAGQAASVMVANPYGITCSGCGFINTPRITLTTGTPQLDAAGGLSGLDVRGGDILVDGAGLDASQSDYFALIARTANLQAGLNARDAQVVLGANRVGSDGRITPQAGSGATPVLALDTGALGGMYANRISLVSTEQGVGVNTAGLSARQGDIQLSATGRLQVGSAIAQGNITAQGGTLVVSGDQQAQGAVALRGEQGITLGTSRTQAGQGLTLSSDGRISADRARLSAGVSDSGTVQPGYGLTLSGAALALGQSQLAGDRLSLSSTGAVSQLAGGAWQAGSGLTLQGDALSLDGDAGAQTLTVSGGSLSGAGRWQSTGDLSLGGLSAAQWDGTLLAGGTLSLDTGRLSNRGTLAGGQVQLTTSVLDNRGTVSGRQVRLQAGQLANSGTLSADEVLSIQAQTGLDNSGSLLSGGGLTIAAGQTVNRGVLSGGTVTLSGDSLWNGGVLQGRQSLGVNALTGFSQTADGALTSGGTVTLSSAALDTAGALSAQGLQLHTGPWRNQGTVNLGGDGQLTLEVLDNSGLLLSSGAWDITGGRLANRGTLQGSGLTLRGDTLDNQGALTGTTQTVLRLGGGVANRGTVSGNRLAVTTSTLDNSGTLLGVDALTLTADGALTNGGTGRLMTQGTAAVTATGVDNDGDWQAGSLQLTADRLRNGGRIQSDGGLTVALSPSGQLVNSGTLAANGEAGLSLGELDNRGTLSVRGGLTVAGAALHNAGQMAAQGALTLKLTGAYDGAGDLYSDGALTLTGTTVSNGGGHWQGSTLAMTGQQLDNRGSLTGVQSLTVTLPGALTNTGRLDGQRLDLTAATLDNSGTLLGVDALTLAITGTARNQAGGRWLSQGDGRLTATALDNQGSWQSGRIDVTAGQVRNAGQLLGLSALTLTADGALINTATGRLLTQGAAVLTATTVDNDGGWQAGSLLLTADSLRNGGRIVSDGGMRITLPATDDAPRLAAQRLAQDVQAAGQGTLSNSGTLAAGGDSRISGRRVENQGMLAGGDLTLTARDVINSGRLESRTLQLTGGQLDNGGTLLAEQGGDLRLSGGLTVGANGRLLSNGDWQVQAGAVLNQGGWQGHSLTLNAASLSNDGTLLATDGVTLSLQQDYTGGAGSRVQGNGAVTLTAQTVTQQGEMGGDRLQLGTGALTNGGRLVGLSHLDVTSRGQLTNTADGALLGNGVATVSAQALTNAGRLEGQRLDLTAATLDNSGTLLGVDALTLAITGTARNQAGGRWLSQGDGRLTATALDNQGSWQSGRIDVTAGRVRNAGQLLGLSALTLTADGALINTATGRLLTQGAAVLTATTVDNDGGWQAGSLLLTADSLRNGGRIVSDGGMRITLPATDDAPRLAAQRLAQDVQAAGQGTLSNSGTLAAGGDSRISGRRVENQGMLAGGDLTLTARDVINSGRLESRTLQLTGGQLDNGGTLLAEQGGDLRLSGGLTVGANGRLLSNGDWQVQAGAVLNQGGWQGHSLTLNAASLSNDGTLLATDGVTLSLQQDYTGGAGSRVQGNGAVTLTAQTVTQQGEMGGDRLQLGTGALTNGGRLVGLSHLDVTSRGQLTNTADGALLGNGVATVSAQALNNAGALQGDALTLQAGTVDNRGRIQGTTALTLDGVSRYTSTDSSQLLSGGTAMLAIDNTDNAGLWQAGDLRLRGTSLTSRGQISGLNSLTVDAASLSNSGQLTTQGLATLRGQQFDNGGTLTALGGFNAQFRDNVTNRAGGQLLSGGSGQLATGTLRNQGLWQSARLSLNAETLDNQGTLLGLDDGTLQLTGAYQGSVNSRVLGNGAFSLNAATIDTAGQWQARDVTLRGGRLYNQGTITGSGQLSAVLDNALENSAGATLAGGTVSLGGATVSNAGQVEGRNGLTVQGGSLLSNLSGGQLLSGGALTLNTTHLTNAGWVQGADLMLTTTQLDNTGTLQAQGGLTLHLPQWSNRGTVQAGQLAITTDGQLDNQGTLLGLTRLALQAAGITNGDGARLYSAGDLFLRTGQLAQNGQLVALGNLQADIGNPFTFTRTLAAGGQLTLNVNGDLVQAGTLQGNGVTVSSTGTLTQQGRIVAGTGTSTLSAAAINQTASGSIQGGGPLSLRADGSITNRGFVGTAADLLLQAGGLIDNSSLLYGGGNLWLLSDALVNRFGNILAGNSLWIQRDAAGNASSSVLNSSGTIETQRGDITVRTGTLTNQREGLTVTESSSSVADMPSWAGGNEAQIPIGYFNNPEDYTITKDVSINDNGGTNGCGCSKVTTYSYALTEKVINGIISVPVYQSSVNVTANGGEARFISGSDILISSGSLNNQASLIGAGRNILLSGSELNNSSYQSGSSKRILYYKFDIKNRKFSNGASDPGRLSQYFPFILVQDDGTEYTPGQSYNATIQAGGAITANFSQNISNTGLQPGSGGFIPAIATPTLSGVTALTPAGAQAGLGLSAGGASPVSGSALSGAGAAVALSGQSGGLGAGYRPVTRDGTVAVGSALSGAAVALSGQAGDPGAGYSPVSRDSAAASGSTVTPAGIPDLGTAGRVALGALPLSDLRAVLAQGLAAVAGPSLNDYPLPTSQNGLFVADTSSNGRYLIRSNPLLSQLGQVDNSLFGDLRGLLGQTPGTRVPVETSPTLTDPTQFLGSSYLLGKLNLDAEHDYRFLGDAAFDTRYISNAMLSQTGQRYLNGVGSDLAQMQTLMDNAAAEKSRLNLQLGVSLSPAQVAGLSHSIVWWENITVDGQTVLAPKLYLAQADKTNLSGSRIVANSVSLSAGGDIDNRGSTVTALNALAVTSGGQVTNSEGGLLNAGGALNLVALGNLTNRSATIQGNTVTLASVSGDIVNTTTTSQWHTQARDGRGGGSLTRTDIGQTGLITAQGGLTLQAGHDIALNGAQLSAGGPLALAAGNDLRLNALGTVTDTVKQSGSARSERRSQGLVQSVLASGGDLSLSAGRDLNGTAAQLSATGTMALSAGRDLTLLAAEQEQFSSNAWNRHLDWQQTVTQQGTVLNAGDGLSLRAGRDLTLQGAQAETRGALTAQAGRDLNLLSATESQHNFFEETTVKKGFLSSTTTHTLREREQTTEKGTLLSAGRVALTAGQDIGVRGSSVAADGDVALTAGHTINTAASVETYRQYEEVSRKKSGLFSGGGIGFTIGSTSQRQTLAAAGTTESQSVSTLGSTGGSVSLRAGQDVNLSGTDVIAARDIQVVGNTVTIDPGYDSHRQSQKMEQKTAGLTVTLSGVVGSALNSAVQAVQAVREQSDSRLQALQGMKAALSGYQAYQGTQVDTNNKGASSFVGISVSLGAQRASSSQSSEQSQSFASTLNAGHDISVVARQGDITAVGSQLKAANNVDLNAAHAINLLSARNTESLTGSNSSSGGNIGVSFGLSNSGAGFSVFANVNAAKGREMGSGNSWSETMVDAGQRVGLTSGGDTRLIGAQVSGDRIVADVGGDLLLASQRDNNRYDSRQTSVSAGGSFTFGTFTGSGYLSASQDKMHSSYDSVQQQTGLFAGQGGYDIHVGNHTQLDGAVIGSTASADKNRLDTGTLGWRNIDNQAVFSVSHSGIGLSASPSLSLSDMMKSAALTAPSALMSMGRGGNASSTTYAAVSDGALIIRNQAGQQQDTATLSRDVEHANNALSPIFDKEKEQKRLQTAQRVGELGSQVMDVIRTEGEIRATRAAEGRVAKPDESTLKTEEEKEKAWESYRKALTETPEYKAVMASYGTGSDLQRAAQAATAAIQSLAGGGNLQQALAGASAPYLAQLVKSVTMPADERKATASDIAANAMGHALMGAVVAQLSGKDAVAGAVGAAGGELTARLLIMKELYGGRDTSDLTEAEKQSVSALSSLAAGLASGIASGSVEGAATGAQAGRNAVENNSLAGDNARQSVKESAEWWKKQIRDKLGEGTTSATANSIINAIVDSGDSAIGSADYVADAAMALASCAAGDSYCNKALSDLSGKNQAVADSVSALMKSETWSAVADTIKQASGGNQAALEATGGMLAGILLPGKKAPALSEALKEPKVVIVDKAKYPESARHIEDAQQAGHPTVLTIDRGGASERRKESLKDTPTVPGLDRDEYPPAMFKEGGSGASVRLITPSDNRGAGACIGAQCRGLPDGSSVIIKTEKEK